MLPANVGWVSSAHPSSIIEILACTWPEIRKGSQRLQAQGPTQDRTIAVNLRWGSRPASYQV